MPVRPHLRCCARGVITNPYELFVGWNRERQPGTVGVVSPQQVIGDHSFGWMNDRDDALERERFIALQVEQRCVSLCQRRETVARDGRRCGIRSGWNVRVRSAGDECRRTKNPQNAVKAVQMCVPLHFTVFEGYF
jgi:hypothetical protein